MSLTKVYIATTNGPVAIERITEEDPDVNSVVCLSGKALALPISHAYHEFVQNPTGVIQRYFGHSAYRVDVSKKIDDGYSWQLGVFTAHALKNINSLAEMNAPAETIVVATGELNRDLHLMPVDRISEKIQHLETSLPELVKEARSILIAVPHGTDGEWRKIFEGIDPSSNHKIELIPARSVDEIFDRLDVVMPSPKSTLPQSTPLSLKKRGRSLPSLLPITLTLAAFFLAVSVLYGRELISFVDYLGMSIKETYQSIYGTSVNRAANETKQITEIDKTPIISNGDPIISIQELRSPPGQKCADLEWWQFQEAANQARQYGFGSLSLNSDNNLCAIKLTAEIQNPKLWIYGRYKHWIDQGQGPMTPTKVIDQGPNNHGLSWLINISNQVRGGAVFRLIIISAPQKFTPPRELISRLGLINPSSNELNTLVDQVKQLGFEVTLSQFRIIK